MVHHLASQAADPLAHGASAGLRGGGVEVHLEKNNASMRDSQPFQNAQKRGQAVVVMNHHAIRAPRREGGRESSPDQGRLPPLRQEIFHGGDSLVPRGPVRPPGSAREDADVLLLGARGGSGGLIACG